MCRPYRRRPGYEMVCLTWSGLLYLRPAPTLVGSARSVQCELNPVTIFESRRIVDFRTSSTQRINDSSCKSCEAARPTAFAHTGRHVVLVNLHWSPRPRSRRRMPEFPSLLNH